MKSLVLSIAAAFIATGAQSATVNQAANFAGNGAAYATWLAAAGGSVQHSLDFETGFVDGQAVSGSVGNGLSIAGIGQGGGDPKIEQGAGNIGGSNPIGSFALEVADDGGFTGQSVLTLTFTSALSYLSFYVIDTAERPVDYGIGSFTSGPTGPDGDSAEFRGIVFDPGETVTTVSFAYVGSGSSGWAVDNLAWGYQTAAIPLPATLPMMLAGFGAFGLLRRKARSNKA